MNKASLFVAGDKKDHMDDVSGTELIFLLQSGDDFALQFPFSHKDFWSLQSHRVSRTPRKLIFHIQRIYYCFKENLPDQLYAALLDLLIALQGKRDGLARRMFGGAEKKLHDKDRKILEKFFNHPEIDANSLPVNGFSVLASGIISSKTLLSVSESKSDELDYEPLMLARDYIEYSQLDEAREVLETAVRQHSGDKDIHRELLELYRSTRDRENFLKMYVYLKEQGSSMLMHWEPLLPLFEAE